MTTGPARRSRPRNEPDCCRCDAGLFMNGLLGPERRKTGWMRAEAAGDPGSWRQQAILGRGRWDDDAKIAVTEAMTLAKT